MGAEPRARPLPNSYWIYPGELLAGEHPRRGVRNSAELRGRLRALMDAGVDSFIDLTMPEEFPPYDLELPPTVRYTRRPIRDHALPARADHMVEILQHIDRELRHGRHLYIHCHAGIGRTGMVAGCLLAERGQPGDAALNALNGLWQSCERSESWPYVPETEEQIEYVRDWQVGALKGSAPAVREIRLPMAATHRLPSEPIVLAQQAPLAGRLRERFTGALIGLAVCDAIATATQGLRAGSFTPVNGPGGGGALNLPPGSWSDDTATALCIAESLLECNASDPRDQVERLTSWQQSGHLSATGECVGITANTAQALAGARWRRQVYPGSHDPKHLDPEVLSRVAPAVMFGFGSIEVVAHLASEVARITCQAPIVLDACRALAASLHAAFEGAPKAQILEPAAEVLDTSGLRARITELRSKAERREPRAGASAPEALAAGLWVLGSTTSFAEGALRAANLGGGCDVVAAVYGQLAGAHYGVQAIPAPWRAQLAHRDWIEGFATQLLAHAEHR